ncbi:MAG: energy transducer TonB, partial [Bryobacteraceae bacterium]
LMKTALLVIGLSQLAASGQTLAPTSTQPAKPMATATTTDLAVSKELDAKLERLVDLLGLPQMLSNAQASVVRSELAKNASTTPEFTAEFMKRFGESQAMRAAIKIAAKQLYATHFTASEIDDLVAFYESPVGQKQRQVTVFVPVGIMGRLTPATYAALLGIITGIARDHPEYLRARPKVAAGAGSANGGAAPSPGVSPEIIGAIPSVAPPPPSAGAVFVPPPPPPPRNAPPSGPPRAGGPLMEAFLIEKVQPIYPPLAKSAGVQGQVEFDAIIAKDGTLQHLQLVHGHPLLVQAATDALQQWRYIPTLVNAEPVDVMTRIIVNFALSP